MSYQDPNQPNQPNQYPGSGQYGGYNPNPNQPQPTDPYAGQQPGGYQQPGQEGYQQPGQEGYQQPGGYQQPYGQPPYGQQNSFNNFNAGGNPNSSMNLDPKLASGLSYLFGWISGLIIFLTEKTNRQVRFHAMQSILYSGAFTVIYIVLRTGGGIIPGLGLAFGCLQGLVSLAFFIGWIFCLFNGFQGKYFKLPYIGDLAEKYANQTPTTPTF